MPEVGQLAPEMIGLIGCADEDEPALKAPSHLFVYPIGVGAETYAGLTVDRKLQCFPWRGASSTSRQLLR